jgi:hypothetical protein
MFFKSENKNNANNYFKNRPELSLITNQKQKVIKKTKVQPGLKNLLLVFRLSESIT